MLSHTTRRNKVSLRSRSELSAMYFSRSSLKRRRLISTRSACSCNVSTCAGNSPRRPSNSRSRAENAVPLLKRGLRSNATPCGKSATLDLVCSLLDIFALSFLCCSAEFMIGQDIEEGDVNRAPMQKWSRLPAGSRCSCCKVASERYADVDQRIARRADDGAL